MLIDFKYKNKCILKINDSYLYINKKRCIKVSDTFKDECIFDVFSTSDKKTDCNKLVMIKHSKQDWWINNNPIIIAYHHFNRETDTMSWNDKNKYELKLLYDIYSSRQILLDKNKKIVNSEYHHRCLDNTKYDICYYEI